jgi:hypothetical protein
MNAESIYLSIYLWLCSPLLGLGCLFSFLIFYTVGITPLPGDQPVARLLPAYRTAQILNKRTQTSMPQVGFAPTIPVFERAKTVHALDREATVIGAMQNTMLKSRCNLCVLHQCCAGDVSDTLVRRTTIQNYISTCNSHYTRGSYWWLDSWLVTTLHKSHTN